MKPRRARLGLGYVPQGRGIFPALSALDNLRFAYPGDAGGQDEAIAAILKDFPRLEPLLDRQAGLLSGGEQQRVGIARAIVTDPTLLLCDEPTGDLDRKSGDEILNLLQALNRQHGKTIVMVTHDPHASARASRTVYLNKGQLADRQEK